MVQEMTSAPHRPPPPPLSAPPLHLPWLPHCRTIANLTIAAATATAAAVTAATTTVSAAIAIAFWLID
jgi:hypothetical protein